MKMHKIEVYVIDFEDFGAEDCAAMIRRDLPDYVLTHTNVVGTADIGEWHDKHKFNYSQTANSDYEWYFNETNGSQK